MSRPAQRRRESTSFRFPRAYTSQLRVELLEPRITPVDGQWLAVFEGLPVGDNLLDQAQYGRNLLSMAGVSAEEVSVTRALDLTGTLLLETPLDADERTLTTELQAVPGFVFVRDYVPAPSEAAQPSRTAPQRGRSESLYGPFDYDTYLARVKNGEFPDQGGPVTDDPEPANSLTNNNAGSTGARHFTQSEISLVAFGNTVVVGFNDSGSNSGGSNKFTGFARSTDGGNTFTDGGTLPTNAEGDAGDPVLGRNETTGRIYFSTLQFSGSGIRIFRSDDNGQTWLPPTQGTPGVPGGSFQDKQWLAVDNFAGAGNGNVYLISREFGGRNGIFLFRSTDHGNTFGPSGGTFIASGNQGAYVTVGPDHAVYAFWWAGSTLQMRKSTDFGVTFGAPVTVAGGLIGGTNGDLGLVGQNNGETFSRTIRSNSFPHVAVNPVTGHLYATFNTRSTSGGTDKGDVYMVTSTNGGATWGPRVKINDDTTANDQWQPTIAVTPDGTKLGIFYYSRQEDTTTADGDPVNNQFKYYGRIGAIVGSTVTFAPSFAISDVASKPEVGRDGVVNGTYMGDYDQAVATPGAFHVTWADNRSLLPNGAGRSDPNVFYKKISLGLTVASTTPAAGSIVSAVPLDYAVNFSEAIDPDSVQAADFTVDGVPADGFTLATDATQVVFHFDAIPITAQGSHTMAMAAGAVLRDSDDSPLAAFSAAFNFDATGLAVASTSPAAGGVFTLPAPLTYVVNFNEAIDPGSVGADDLTLSAGVVTGAVAIEDPDNPGVYRSARYTIGGVTAEGLLNITVVAGKLRDAFGNPNPASFTATYATDYGTVPYPTPLVAKDPRGSLIYDPTAGSVIAPAGDTDSFTLNVDAGQTITVLVTPPTRTLYGGIGNAGSNVGALVALDPATAQGVVVGNAVGPAGLSGLAFDAPAGVFYGSTVDGPGSRSNLVRINPESGVATTVGAITDGATGLGMSIGDLALQPGTGVLYGIRSNADGTGQGGRLYRIDKATGVATLVGNTGTGVGGGIAFAPSGILYHVTSSLAVLDLNTAARTYLANMPTYFDGLAVRSDGVLFAATGGSNAFVYTINPFDYTTSVVGSSGVGSSSDIDFRTTVLQPVVELRSPDGTVIGSATAPTSGKPALLQTVPASVAGIYTLSVSGVAGTMGSYTMQVVLNAALEAEASGGAPNGSPAAAQDLDPSFLDLGETAGRGAVLGNVSNSVDTDYYAVTLAAGDTVSVAVKGLSFSNFVNFDLRNSTGSVLATAFATGTNADRVLNNFLVAASDTYRLVVWGAPGNYSLVVTRDADFDTENNDSFSTAQNVGDAHGALGHLAAGAGLVRVSSFTAPLGTLVGLGHDPATGNLYTSNGLSQIVRYSPTGVELGRIPQPGNSSDELDLDFFGESVNLGGLTVPAGSLLVVNGDDFPDTVRALNKDTGAVLATLNVSGASASVGGTYHAGRDALFLVNWSSDLISEVNPATGAVLATFSVNPAGAPFFDIFFGDMDVDPATGNLLLVSSSQARIRVLTPTGGFVRDIDVSALGVSGMSGIAVDDRNGDIWLSTTGGSVIRLANVSSDDWYSFAANSGDNLSIQTVTPGSGAGEFVNTLNPKVELYDPSGVLVASGAALADGKNERLLHTAAATGLFRVRVIAEGGTTGEYFVSIAGNTGTEQPAFRVTGTNPPDGANLLARPTTYTVTLNDAFLQSSVQASDLKVDGISATSFTYFDGRTLIFTLPTTFGPGSTHTVTIDQGAVLDVQGTPISAFSATFTLDTVAPRVAATLLAPGGVVAPGSLSYQVTFDEPMKVSNLTTDDFSLRGNILGVSYSASSFFFNSAGTVLTLNYVNLPEDNYTLTLVGNSSLNFTDLLGNALDGEFTGTFPSGNGTAGGNFAVSFSADVATEAYPIGMTAGDPLGSLIYSGQAITRMIVFAGDTDRFTLSVDPGQTVTVVMTPAGSLLPTLEVRDPTGVLVGTGVASAAGKRAVVQTAPAAAGGVYTVTAGVAGSATGLYTVQVTLNAALEAESNDGAPNNSLATAQGIGGSFIGLQPPTAAARGAVIGTTDVVSGALPGESEPNNTTASANNAAGNFVAQSGSPLYHLGLKGNVSPSGDLDYYNIGQLQAGDVITITQSGGGSGRGTNSDTLFEVYRGSASGPIFVTSNDDGGPGLDSFLRFTVTATDTYYINARGFGGTPGTYDLAVFLQNTGTAPTTGGTVTSEVEGNNSAATATNVSTSWRRVQHLSRTAGNLTSGDVDVFSYQLTAGDLVSINIDSLSSLAAQVRLRNSAGAIIASESGESLFGDSPINGFIIPATGTYYVEVLAWSGTGTYNADVHLSTNTAPPVPTPATPDVYAYTLNAGETAALALKNHSAGNLTLTLQNAAGVTLATGVGGAVNLDRTIGHFVAPATGTYYVLVGGDGGVKYSLVATKNAALDTEANDSSATAQPLGGAHGVLGTTGGGNVGAAIRVAVVGSTYATVVANQLNNDTYFNFTATAVSSAQVDTAAELSNYDVVVLGDYPTPITAAAAGAIRTWVEAGLGGIVSTAWINYNMYFYSGATVASILDPIVPINLSPADPNYWYTPATTINITDAGHPVTQGVTNFSPGYGEAPPTPDAGATVLGRENYYGRPAVVVNQAGNGKTVYLTPAYGYDTAWTTGAADRLLEQAVAWTAPTRETADWYSINVVSTAHPLRLETSTPAGGPSEFVNTLNPRIELYDPSGVLVASGTALPDGKNEFIRHTPLTTGLYRVRVVGEGVTNGEYFLGANFLPVAQNDFATTNEETEVAVNVLANDSDVDGALNPATVEVVSGPANGTVSINTTTGVVTYEPRLNYFGTDSFTYRVKDNDGGVSNVATVSLTINPVNDAPTASNSPASQGVQYSDPIAPVTVAAADADSNGSSLTVSTTYTVNGGAAAAGLPNGLSLVLASTTEGGPFPGGPAGARSWTVGGIADVAPGVYAVTAVVSDNHPTDPRTTTTLFTITVAAEDAAATYTGALFVSTSSQTSSTATVTLAATIRDITAAFPASDPYAGDIRNATVTFVNRDTGVVIATVPLVLVDPSDATVATAVYSWAVDIGQLDSATYTVGIRVNGRYTRDAAEDNVVVTVSRPLDNFVTGGGHLTLTNSAGAKAGDAGSRVNFGLSAKFNQSGTNLQGRVNILVRRTEADGQVHVYQIKGNNLNSLAIQPATATDAARATVTGTASIQDVTDPANPIPIEGNATVQITLSDAGEPGSSDMIGMTVWTKSGALWFSSRWDGTRTVEQVLSGGNLQVRPAYQVTGGGAAAGTTALSAEQVLPFFQLALDMWRADGADPHTLMAAGVATVRIADLAGPALAAATPGVLWIDVDAAGHGWFVDPTPEDDSEFTAPGDQGEQGRVDLLSAVLHELGHLLGHDHEAEGLMAEALSTGIRVGLDEHDGPHFPAAIEGPMAGLAAAPRGAEPGQVVSQAIPSQGPVAVPTEPAGELSTPPNAVPLARAGFTALSASPFERREPEAAPPAASFRIPNPAVARVHNSNGADDTPSPRPPAIATVPFAFSLPPIEESDDLSPWWGLDLLEIG